MNFDNLVFGWLATQINNCLTIDKCDTLEEPCAYCQIQRTYPEDFDSPEEYLTWLQQLDNNLYFSLLNYVGNKNV